MTPDDPARKKFAAAASIAEPQAPALTAGDIARRYRKSVPWIKHLAAELRLAEIRTGAGIRLYSQKQAEAIGREIERRRKEAAQ